jgi:hypothetical protein
LILYCIAGFFFGVYIYFMKFLNKNSE